MHKRGGIPIPDFGPASPPPVGRLTAWRRSAFGAARGDLSRTLVRKLIPGAGPVTFNQLWRCTVLLLAAAAISLTRGFPEPVVPVWVADASKAAFLIIYWINLFTSTPGVAGRAPLSAEPLRRFIARLGVGTDERPFPPRTPGGLTRFDLAMVLLAALGLILSLTGRQTTGELIFDGAVCTILAAELWRLNVLLSRSLPSPGVLLPLSFMFLIAVGTFILKLPVCIEPDREPLAWTDSLFTMTSAVCVTGLTVRNTAHDFSATGQIVIGAFIQLGGLGIILFGSTLAMLLGGQRSLRENLSLAQMLSDQPLHKLTSFARFVVLTAVTIELLGALAMYPLWSAHDLGPISPERRLGLSVFHSISAFCNAGFDITGDSLVPLRSSPITHFIIAPLIVLGGLGFPALRDVGGLLLRRFKQVLRKLLRPGTPLRLPAHKQHLTLHTRLVLITTLGLYLFGLIVIGTGQLTAHLRNANPPASASLAVGPPASSPPDAERVSILTDLADASFMSLSARTAGFNSLPMDQIEPTGRFALMALMLVGGSPGSTAGGMKTTVLAVLVLSIFATVMRRDETEAFGRTIADAVVKTAGTIGLCYLGLISFSTILLTLTENLPFEKTLFEVISAATTTGLSLGATSELSEAGKMVIVLTMFLGRIGPLALLGSIIFTRPKTRRFRYAHESVTLG